MKKILAVSGGIDSMVMFDLMKNDDDVIVAHFNHGTRPSADADEQFVKKAAKRHNLPFFSEKAALGEHVSEEVARTARYNFLRKIAKAENGLLYTAHHKDDLIESIIINFLRGTGWRGLAPMSDPTIVRPLLDMTKNDIIKYAATQNITFRQDPTNNEDDYLRNRVREKLRTSEIDRDFLIEFYDDQTILKSHIDRAIFDLLPENGIYQRAWFKALDDTIALELLRAALAKKDLSATRPQLTDFLAAIRTYPTGKKFNLPEDRLITLERDIFMV
jgi:tRNA(Ile)-lysidine synthase